MDFCEFSEGRLNFFIILILTKNKIKLKKFFFFNFNRPFKEHPEIHCTFKYFYQKPS